MKLGFQVGPCNNPMVTQPFVFHRTQPGCFSRRVRCTRGSDGIESLCFKNALNMEPSDLRIAAFGKQCNVLQDEFESLRFDWWLIAFASVHVGRIIGHSGFYELRTYIRVVHEGEVPVGKIHGINRSFKIKLHLVLASQCL